MSFFFVDPREQTPAGVRAVLEPSRAVAPRRLPWSAVMAGVPVAPVEPPASQERPCAYCTATYRPKLGDNTSKACPACQPIIRAARANERKREVRAERAAERITRDPGTCAVCGQPKRARAVLRCGPCDTALRRERDRARAKARREVR